MINLLQVKCKNSNKIYFALPSYFPSIALGFLSGKMELNL